MAGEMGMIPAQGRPTDKDLTWANNATAGIDPKVVESMVLRGDLSGLNPTQRASYYIRVCERLGLDPYAQPFAFLRLNGKEILYAGRGATDQLAAMHKLTRKIIDGPKVIDLAGTKLVYAVAEATHPNGRVETSTATVPLVDPVNVLMKCETKAKRRVTLSILGLGMLDEAELDTIPANVQEPGGGLVLPPREQSTQSAPPPEQSTQSAPVEGEIVDEEPEGPSSRSWATFVLAIVGTKTLAEIHNVYNALLYGLHEEGGDVEHFTQGDDGAGNGAYARMRALGHRLSNAECAQVLRSRPLASLLDEQSTIAPSDNAVSVAAQWWVSHRERCRELEDAHRKTPWFALVRRYSGAAQAADTKRASAALEAAVKLLDKPTPPTGTDAPKGTSNGARAQGNATETSSPTAPTSARGLLDEYRAHLASVPDRGADRGAARIAGGYFKRREDFTEAGVRAEALGLVVDELERRGVAEPHTWLTEIGERNGYVTRTQKRAA